MRRNRRDRVAADLERLQSVSEQGPFQFTLASGLSVHEQLERAAAFFRAVWGELGFQRHLPFR